MEQQKSKKFVGNGRLITTKDSTGFGMSICITDLFELCMKDPEVSQFIYVSEKTGKKYLPLIAWPLKEVRDEDKFRTHAISIDTYKKDEAKGQTTYAAKPKAAPKENKFDDVFQDSFPTVQASTSTITDDDLPF
tara:strand:- start:1846 stop:2247 length:402 start_codon:yes stop_codon:yes gene_type:complete